MGLRYRIVFAFMLLGGLSGIVIALILYTLTLGMERRLVNETLSAELQNFIGKHQQNPATPPLNGLYLRGLVVDNSNAADMPPALRTIKPGSHHLELDGADYFAQVLEVAGFRYVMLFTDRQIRHHEHRFLLLLGLGTAAITLFTTALGYWLAGRIISPLSRLASEVLTLTPEQGDSLNLDAVKDNDEVGRLAQAINHYQSRLAAFVERERDFTGNVSHELRTPLAVINGAAEVLQADPAMPATSRKPLERIKRAARQMTRLTTALLALAREQGVSPGVQHDCDVAKILRNVIEEHRYLLEHKPLQIVQTIEAGAIIKADPMLLYVVIANLVRNACSYTNKGEVRIALQGYAITVGDTGIGMESRQLARMFERYYSIHASENHGIGMSLSKRICEHYGWQISVASQPGKGTVITLLLNSNNPVI